MQHMKSEKTVSYNIVLQWNIKNINYYMCSNNIRKIVDLNFYGQTWIHSVTKLFLKYFETSLTFYNGNFLLSNIRLGFYTFVFALKRLYAYSVVKSLWYVKFYERRYLILVIFFFNDLITYTSHILIVLWPTCGR